MVISLKTCTSVEALTKFINKQPQEYLRHFGSTDPISLLNLDFLYFIYEDDDEEVVGIIGCRYKETYFIQEFNKKYWIITMVDFNHRNKGIATTATKLLFRELPGTITEIYSGVNKDNHANIRVKEKLGFSMARTKSNTIVYRYDRQTHL